MLVYIPIKPYPPVSTVIGAIARMMQHKEIRDAILESKSAAEIHEILHSEEGESFNHFLSS